MGLVFFPILSSAPRRLKDKVGREVGIHVLLCRARTRWILNGSLITGLPEVLSTERHFQTHSSRTSLIRTIRFGWMAECIRWKRWLRSIGFVDGKNHAFASVPAQIRERA